MEEVRRNYEFLSTPSARRATRRGQLPRAEERISIHALREEGDLVVNLGLVLAKVISIHALREEGDQHDTEVLSAVGTISIHALREEGDCCI